MSARLLLFDNCLAEFSSVYPVRRLFEDQESLTLFLVEELGIVCAYFIDKSQHALSLRWLLKGALGDRYNS